MRRGDIYLADLGSVRGTEQAGKRPVLIFQNDGLTKFTSTVVVIPFTTNIRMSRLPSCVLVPKREGGLHQDSVALCHQIRALDKSRLKSFWGKLPISRLNEIEKIVGFTLGYQNV